MNNPNSNTEHRKGQQLTAEERHDIVQVSMKGDIFGQKKKFALNRPCQGRLAVHLDP